MRAMSGPGMRRWPCCLWLRGLTLALFVLATLAPTVSRALARTQPPALQQVCSSAGLRPLAEAASAAGQDAVADLATGFLGMAAAADGRAAMPLLDHCPLCLLVAERLGPPPAALLHFFNADSGLVPSHAQALFFPDTAPQPLWPRGPPR